MEGQKGRSRSKEKSDSSLNLKALTPTPLHRRDDNFDYLFFLKRFYEGVVLDTVEVLTTRGRGKVLLSRSNALSD